MRLHAHGYNDAVDSSELVCCRLEDFVDPAFLQALAEPTRFRIVSRLADLGEGYMTVGAIAEGSPTHVSVISRHLTLLRDAGVVEADRRGREVYYRLRHREVAATLRALAAAVEAAVPSADTGLSTD